VPPLISRIAQRLSARERICHNICRRKKRRVLLAALLEFLNQRHLTSMAFNPPRAVHFSTQSLTDDAFARAATSLSPRRGLRQLPFADLSTAGVLACALTAGLLASTPGTARAETKPAASKAATAKSRPAKPPLATAKAKASPQACVAKTSGVVSIVSRPRVSPIGALQSISASSRWTGAENSNTKAATPVGDDVEETNTTISALPAAPVSRSPIQLAAAPQTKTQTETTVEKIAVTQNPAENVEKAVPAPSSHYPASNSPENSVSPAVGSPQMLSLAVSTVIPKETVSNETIAPVAETQSGEPLMGTVDFSAGVLQAGSTPVVEAAPADGAQAGAVSSPSRLYAPSISYEGGTIVAQGTPENPVRLESPGARIIAQSVRLDTVGKTVSAQGTVRVERQLKVQRYTAFGEKQRSKKGDSEIVTETLQGENFEYNYETKQGQLGATKMRLANFNISAESLIINGQKYVAHNVVVRPGGLSDEEIKIYGTPPFNLRLRDFTVDLSKPAATGAEVSDTGKNDSASVNFGGRAYGKGGWLYFKNTRILPVPSAFLNRSLGKREESTYQITPRISTNSSDGILLTTKLYFPIARENPDRLSLAADVGISTKIGFRGGVELESSNRLGNFSLGARINDIVETQLTNRIELDRLPELRYSTPKLALFDLPGGRSAGLKFGFVAGDYRERFTDGSRETRSSRLQGQMLFTTRLARRDGPYLDLFARASQYSVQPENLRTAGFEVGYMGPLTRRLSGRFSYSATSVSGSTPFRFDQIEIRRELRATFDILLTPRYIIPIDLRYDVDRHELRDKRFGILRNYKTFAYGVTYQSSRREIQLEIRQGF
jgi:hypothetical protein